MTSIEWLIEQLQAPCRGIPSHIIEQAIEMHTKEVTNCNHLEITDEEIEEAADKYVAEDEFNRLLKDFEEGAKWYREQLKQRQ